MKKIIFLKITIILSVSSSAHAIDCKKSLNLSERTICKSEKLQTLDESLNLDYKNALKGKEKFKNETEDIKSTQKQWIKNRNSACLDNIACLEKFYTERILQLRSDPKKNAIQEEINYRTISKTSKTPVDTNLSHPEFYGTNKKSVELLNKIVKNIWLDDNGCELPEKDSKSGGEYTRGLSVEKFTKNILILNDSADYSSPSAAHPDNYNINYIFEVTSGERINLWEKITDNNKNKLLELILKNGLKEHGSDKDCVEEYQTRLKNSIHLSIDVERKKITLEPSFMHALRACEESITIPLEEFKKYFKDNEKMLLILNDI